MSTRSRQEYFAILRERYQKCASKNERSLVVDEGCLNTGLHRKSVIRALNTACEPDTLRQLGRKRKYSNDAIGVLKQLSRDSEYVCSDKLKAMIPILLEQFDRGISLEVRNELMEISPASIDGYLRVYRGIEKRKRRSGTRPGSRLFKRLIPLKSLTLISPRCGYLEADTVAHCGGSLAGEFIWSLTITDTYSGWTENRGCFGKCAKNVLPAIESIHHSLPFEIVSFNVDNGSEFLNHRVYEYFQYLGKSKTIPFPMSRSRSYHKNDNAHVEQKNWTTVRQLFGYDRFSFKELLPIMNEIYQVQSDIQNFFVPQFKLKSKQRIEAKIKKIYDKPVTPLTRVLADKTVSESMKKYLKTKFESMNYYKLKSKKEALLACFIKLFEELKSSKQESSKTPRLTAPW